MNKKADTEQILFFFMYLVLAIAVFIFLFYFINNSLTLEGQKTKILAKEIALLIDFAKPGTTISVNTEGYVVSFDGKNMDVVVQAKSKTTKYAYQYFALNKFSSKYEGDKLILTFS